MLMPMSEKTLRNVMMDTAVDQTLTMVADMAGLTREKVTTIVETGLPMMADVADGDPLVFKAMFAQSVKALPMPTPQYYSRLAKDATARRLLVDAFTAMYGPATASFNDEAATRAGVTTKQAGQVLATTMPAVVKAIGNANLQKNEMGFGRQLRNLNA